MSLYGSITSVTVPLKSGVRLLEDLMGRERMTRALQEASKLLMGALRGVELKGFTVKTVELLASGCVPLLIWYSCYIPEG